MSYRVRLDGQALVQHHGLPSLAFEALVERVADLVDAPWDADPMNPARDLTCRQAMFGQGYGLVSFHVDEPAQVVRIFDIVWIG